MNAKKIMHSAYAGALALICLHNTHLSAQELIQPAATGNSLRGAVITSGSGATRSLRPYLGFAGRVALAPNQLVTVTLEFSEAWAGKPVVVGSLDGGEINPHLSVPVPITVLEDGTASFAYKGSNAIGLYRVLVRLQTEEYRLEFRVLDPVNLQNNPPRHQIVY
jgi:hypothetical protein